MTPISFLMLTFLSSSLINADNNHLTLNQTQTFLSDQTHITYILDLSNYTFNNNDKYIRINTITPTHLNPAYIYISFNDEHPSNTNNDINSFTNGENILYVSHEEDDGMWQFLCGKSHEITDAKLVALEEVFALDNSISKIADMPYGYIATRKNVNSEWKIHKK